METLREGGWEVDLPVGGPVQGVWREGLWVWVQLAYRPDLPPLCRALGGRWSPERRAWRFSPGGAEALLQELGLPPAPFLPSLSPEEEELAFLKERLYPEQVEDLLALWGAFRRSLEEPASPKGFVLANGTGTGKTYVYGGFIYLLRRRGFSPLLVLPGEGIRRQIGGALRGLGLEEGRDYRVTTYAKLPGVSPPQVLILDEAYLVKGLFASKRGRLAYRLGKEAGFVLYVTATPWDRPWEARYLEAVGLHRLTGDRDFDAFIRRFGVGIREGFGGGKEYYF